MRLPKSDHTRQTAPRTSRPTLPPAPAPLDAGQLAALAERVIAGDVVQPANLADCCALLAVLQGRGYELKRRTDWEQRAAPWRLIVVPTETEA